MMFRILLVLFFLIPLLEIYLLIQVGGWIGPLYTVFLVVFTALLGAFLLRAQGFATLQRVRATMARGELPAMEMLEGALLLIGGALLLTPGFFTDAIGFVCLIPQLRQGLLRWALKRGVVMGMAGSATERSGPQTLNGEYWRDDEKPPK